jgi:hypothetical protein
MNKLIDRIGSTRTRAGEAFPGDGVLVQGVHADRAVLADGRGSSGPERPAPIFPA